MTPHDTSFSYPGHFCLWAALMTTGVEAQSIAYDIRTAQLASTASYFQVDLGNCVRGNWRPSATVNGLTHGGLIQCPEFDGWATTGEGGELQDQYILWTFRSGCTPTNGMQLLQSYSVSQYAFYLNDFAISYTTSPNPTLQSDFHPLTLTGLSGVSGYVVGNNVRAFPGSWSASGQDYRVDWVPTSATAIRLHVYPTQRGYVVTEVSFRSAPGSVASYAVFGDGCSGTNGAPILRPAPGSRPALGTTLTVQITQLPDPFQGATPPFGLLGITRLASPVRLGMLGRPDCLLHISIDGVTSPLPTSGSPFIATWSMLIPNDCNFIGASIYQQCAQIDLAANSFVVSNAGQAVIGH